MRRALGAGVVLTAHLAVGLLFAAVALGSVLFPVRRRPAVRWGDDDA